MHSLSGFRDESLENRNTPVDLEHIVEHLVADEVPVNREMDEWVASYFSNRQSVPEILDGLSSCTTQ